MEITARINTYFEAQPETTRSDLHELHNLMLRWLPNGKLWFDEGINAEGKVVTNPRIGYGSYMHTFADKSRREFFQIGICATKNGISIYFMGVRNKLNIAETFGNQLGKVKVTGYCVTFKKLEDLNLDILEEAVLRSLTCTQKEP